MRYSKIDIVYQEVPNEISLAFFITGCPMRCPGCHSKEYQNPKIGNVLDSKSFENKLKQYKGLISCVCFFGGEWDVELKKLLDIAHTKYKLKTCLYTGRDLNNKDVVAVKPFLDFVKYGPYIQNRGGIQSKNTNQVFFDLNKNKSMTFLFQK